MRKKADSEPRTVEMRCVTHRTWRVINRLMDEAEQAIPEAHVRKRVQVRGEVFKREVDKRAKVREVDPRGREVYCSHRRNLGTKNWSHVVDACEKICCADFDEGAICYVPGDHRYWRFISDCVCVYG